MRKFLLLTTTLSLLNACDLSSEFALPEMGLSGTFLEAPTPAPEVAVVDAVQWKRVDAKTKIEETAWWKMFQLPELDTLEEQAMKDNPSLEVALQRVNSARGMADVSASSLLPSVSVGAGPQRQQQSESISNANSPAGFTITPKPFNSYTAQGSITYMLDLFGKQRNTARAADRDADALENDYRAARLALQAELAQAYIQRSALLSEDAILTRTVATRTTTRDHVKKKHAVGSVDDLVLANAQAELANAEAERAAIAQQLAASEHQIAALVGVTPAQLTLGKTMLKNAPPTIPAGVPATVMTRRPDIQSAAQTIAAANARIGAARAGYFPDISLSASGGFSSLQLKDLFKKSSQFWSLGPMAGGTILTQPLFEGGKIEGTLAARKADYEAASANYRASVLQAFREVEDSLSSLRNLGEQAKAREAALKAARRANVVAGERYKVGYASQLETLDVERGLLAAERGDVQVLGQRYVATIQLIKALGGSWQ